MKQENNISRERAAIKVAAFREWLADQNEDTKSTVDTWRRIFKVVLKNVAEHGGDELISTLLLREMKRRQNANQ